MTEDTLAQHSDTPAPDIQGMLRYHFINMRGIEPFQKSGSAIGGENCLVEDRQDAYCPLNTRGQLEQKTANLQLQMKAIAFDAVDESKPTKLIKDLGDQYTELHNQDVRLKDRHPDTGQMLSGAALAEHYYDECYKAARALQQIKQSFKERLAEQQQTSTQRGSQVSAPTAFR